MDIVHLHPRLRHRSCASLSVTFSFVFVSPLYWAGTSSLTQSSSIASFFHLSPSAASHLPHSAFIRPFPDPSHFQIHSFMSTHSPLTLCRSFKRYLEARAGWDTSTRAVSSLVLAWVPSQLSPQPTSPSVLRRRSVDASRAYSRSWSPSVSCSRTLSIVSFLFFSLSRTFPACGGFLCLRGLIEVVLIELRASGLWSVVFGVVARAIASGNKHTHQVWGCGLAHPIRLPAGPRRYHGSRPANRARVPALASVQGAHRRRHCEPGLPPPLVA